MQNEWWCCLSFLPWARLSCVRNSCVVTVAIFILIGPWQRLSIPQSSDDWGLCRRNRLRERLRVLS